MPGGLHPLFVVAGAIMISALTSLAGGSGLLAVYVAGLVMANRPTRAYPSIVGFHDAVTWLCQIVMFLVLGLLVTPTRALGLCAAGAARRAGPDPRRPAARGLALPRRRSASRGARSSSSPGSACAARSRSSSPRSRRSPACRNAARLLQHRLLRGAAVAARPGLDADHRGAPARAWRSGRRRRRRAGSRSISPARPSRRSSAIR